MALNLNNGNKFALSQINSKPAGTVLGSPSALGISSSPFATSQIKNANQTSSTLLGNPQNFNTGLIGNNAFNKYQIQQMGQPAKSPDQNVTPPSNTLPANQAKTYSNQAPATASEGPGKMTFDTNQNAGLMAALARQNAGDIRPEDTKNLQYARSKGWQPTTVNAAGTSGEKTSNAQIAQSKVAPADISSKGILTSLVGTAQAGSPIAQTAQTGLLGMAQTNAGTSGQAYQDYQTAVNELNTLKQNIAQETGNIESNPIPLEFQQGRKQILQSKSAALLDAAQQKVNQAQAAIGYQLTGAGLQQQGLSTAGSLGQTGQGLTQSGLTSAAGYAQPVQVPYGTPLVNPQTGQTLSGGGTTGQGVQPGDPFYQTLEQYAQLMASNQGSAVPGFVTSNPVLNAQVLQMAKQINPNFNVNVAAGAGGAQTAVAGQQASQIQGYQSALQQGKNLQSQLGDLINTFGLNPADINAVNQGLQTIARNISDPRYQMLQNYVNDIANTYSQILTPAGGTATDTTRGIASSMLNSTMSGQGLMAVMNSLDQAAQAKISGVSTGGGLGGSIPTGSGLYNW